MRVDPLQHESAGSAVINDRAWGGSVGIIVFALAGARCGEDGWPNQVCLIDELIAWRMAARVRVQQRAPAIRLTPYAFTVTVTFTVAVIHIRNRHPPVTSSPSPPDGNACTCRRLHVPPPEPYPIRGHEIDRCTMRNRYYDPRGPTPCMLREEEEGSPKKVHWSLVVSLAFTPEATRNPTPL